MKKIALSKKSISFVVFSLIALIVISYFTMIAIRKSKFENMIDKYYYLLACGDYDNAVDLIYYKPEHVSVKDFYLQELNTNGTPIIGCEIIWTKHIGIGLYQSYVRMIDGYDNDTSYKFFFEENGNWMMAAAQFELPDKYQTNPNLQIDERIFSPDDVTLLN